MRLSMDPTPLIFGLGAVLGACIVGIYGRYAAWVDEQFDDRVRRLLWRRFYGFWWLIPLLALGAGFERRSDRVELGTGIIFGVGIGIAVAFARWVWRRRSRQG